MSLDKPPELSFLTADIPGIGGIIKAEYEDFQVEEIALYEPCGSGNHIYLYLEKTGMATTDVINRLSRELKVSRKSIGYAGRKDTRAVTSQWLSIENVDPDVVANLDIPRCKVLKVGRHNNKIKIGHHSGNRFLIRIRELDLPGEQALELAQAVLEKLCKFGVPNYFGPQRFGSRFDSHILGHAVARNECEDFIDHLLGKPSPNTEMSVIYAARSAYEAGDYQAAHDAWPKHYHDQRQALRTLMKTDGNKKQAFNILDRRLKRFVLSAYQAYVFNDVITARIDTIATIVPGELAFKHDSGAVFRVADTQEDAKKEQPRADAFDISPSGPLIGLKMAKPTGKAAEIEEKVVEQAELELEDYRKMNTYRLRGARRPLRFQPRNAQVRLVQNDSEPEFLELTFELPPGCYATTLVTEITKKDDWQKTKDAN